MAGKNLPRFFPPFLGKNREKLGKTGKNWEKPGITGKNLKLGKENKKLLNLCLIMMVSMVLIDKITNLTMSLGAWNDEMLHHARRVCIASSFFMHGIKRQIIIKYIVGSYWNIQQ